MTISENKIVAVSYELYVDGDEGSTRELMEQTTEERPLRFIFGMGMMLEKFEENLRGLSLGDTFDFSIPAEEAYGKYEEDYVLELDKSLFEVDGKIDTDNVFVGNMIPMVDNEGQRINGTVIEISENTVTMDFNHPLAGETLYFKGEIISVREAVEEEIAAAMRTKQNCTFDGCSECNCGC